ncbi:PTS sugar transporter subunit IIA [Halanaerobaculum tunisiense]
MFNIFGSQEEEVELVAPVTGEVIELSEVPDDVFASKAVGDGLAIEPTEGILVAPVEGVAKQVFPTKHAIGLETAQGIELLLHIGINTVELDGAGFEKLIEEGDEVEAGQELIEFDLEYIEQNATATVTPFLVTNMDEIEDLEVVNTGQVTAGQDQVLTVTIE